jgi:hypothetical protein
MPPSRKLVALAVRNHKKKLDPNSSLLHVLVHQNEYVVVLSILETNMYLCLLLANNWGRDRYRPHQVLVYEIAKHHRDVVMYLVY